MSVVLEREDIVQLQAKFGDRIIFAKENRGDAYVGVATADLVAVMTYLRDDLGFDYFVECVGVDYSAWKHPRDLEGRFEVVYNLYSVGRNVRLFVKTSADLGQSIPTIKDVWLGAEYPEREIQDLYGVAFEGNAEEAGERFLLPNDWVGFPLRKEYPLGGEDVVFDQRTLGPAIEDLQRPHAGESWEGKTGSEDVSGR